jgi:hypothetical protein
VNIGLTRLTVALKGKKRRSISICSFETPRLAGEIPTIYWRIVDFWVQ